MSDFIMYFDTLNGSLEGKLDAAAKQFKKKRVWYQMNILSEREGIVPWRKLS